MMEKRILIWGTILFMLSGVCFTSAAQETPETNLVINGNFESGFEHWQVDKPADNKVEAVPGPWGKSVRLTSSNKSGSTYIIQYIDPAQVKDHSLSIRAKMKAENVVLGTFSYSNAKIALVWSDKGCATHFMEKDFTGTFDW